MNMKRPLEFFVLLCIIRIYLCVYVCMNRVDVMKAEQDLPTNKRVDQILLKTSRK